MDARRSPRTPYKGWVEILCDGQRVRGEGRGLSTSGLGLWVPSEIRDPQGTRTSEFALPGISLPLELSGHWAWHDARTRRGGIRFEGVDAGIADLLANFVAGRL